MRLALVVAGGVDRSGRQRVIPVLLALIERLARRHDVMVYVLRYHEHARSYPLLGAMVHDLGRPRGVRRQYLAVVEALKRDGPFDVVHGYWGLPSGLVASAAGRRLGIPSVVTCDGGEFVAIRDIAYGAQRGWRGRAGVTAATRLAARVTVSTKYQADLARAHGLSPQVLPLGVDRRVFTKSARAGGPPWRLLHVASINPVKDHETLLRAFEALVAGRVDARLDIVGEDTMGGAIQELAGRLDLRGRVAFRGFLPADEIVPLYQQSHLFVLSSRHEAAGTVVLEAAASGVPVVGTAVGYIADWSPDRAVAVPPQNARALAEAMASLLADDARRARIALAAQDWTLAHDADWSAAEIERLYADVRKHLL